MNCIYNYLVLVMQIKCVISICNHIYVCTLLNCHIHSVIDGITGPTTSANPAEAAALAEVTAPIPVGGLVEWDKRDII